MSLGTFASFLNQGAQKLMQQQPAAGSFGSPLTGMAGATQSGRSWLDPTRMAEREARLRDRMLRQQAAGGGGGGGRAVQQSPLAPLPEGAQFTNATTGLVTTVIPPTATDEGTKSAARLYGRKRLESMGVRFEPKIGTYDPRTGLSQTLTLSQAAMRPGLLGSAQRALIAGLNSGMTFSRTNPFV